MGSFLARRDEDRREASPTDRPDSSKEQVPWRDDAIELMLFRMAGHVCLASSTHCRDSVLSSAFSPHDVSGVYGGLFLLKLEMLLLILPARFLN
jgi:hypothetical protein